MALIENLIEEIEDAQLRAKIDREVRALKERTDFGLVFERHIPESVLLNADTGLRVGDEVRIRDKPKDKRRLRVKAISGAKATVSENGHKATQVPISKLQVVRRFDEPVYPALTSVGSVGDHGAEVCHLLIEGENFHALRLLEFALARSVDVIYIDPPYNTGERDWKYNNDYVDINDSWRHSKWLSMMEKRLKIAKRVLKPDSVLVVTIDEHEVHHLGVLLDALFPEARRQMVTIVNNAAGVSQGGFYRVEENAFFLFFGNAKPVPGADDLLSEDEKTKAPPVWFSLCRYGGSNSVPSKRPGLVYPIGIDPKTGRVAASGPTLKDRLEAGEQLGDLDQWTPDPAEKVDGKYPAVWPFRADGTLSTWQVKPETLHEFDQEGFIRVRPQTKGAGGNAWSVSYVRSGNQKKIKSGQIPTSGREPKNGPWIVGEVTRDLLPKTVWKRARHDAGKWGSRVLKAFVPGVAFDYPKSPYAVLDVLNSVVGDNQEAVILDFFAGSGTTLQATAMLNRQTAGRRRCIAVTNNEVAAKRAEQLHKEGIFSGDPQFEKHGVFEAVARPRVHATITGKTPSGKKIKGEYLDGTPYANGFQERAEFLRIEYLDPEQVELGRALDALHPLMWLTAGGRGPRPKKLPANKPFLVAEPCGYAVLLDERALTQLIDEIRDKEDVRHIFLVTDYEDAYAEMASALGPGRTTHMVPRDYLRKFGRAPLS